ncbi:hypothetical protein [Chlorobium sp. N1]|uniref:hypothetical protein n=1 Tax=Chlorobium sp. N1 TaxID=2491138 RepID=UPI001F601F15|nr:hypothetical protein [Chlorobium sp. N1]
MLACDSVHGRKAEPRPAPARLRRKEGLENVRQHLALHARPAVGEPENSAVVGTDRLSDLLRHQCSRNGCRLYQKRTAALHGVLGVDGKVHHDLLDLSEVPPDGKRLFRQREIHDDVILHGPAQELLEPPDGGIEVEHMKIESLAAAEDEKLADKVAGPDSGAMDCADILETLVIGTELVVEDLGIPENRRQEIVEVVGHPAGKPADGLHLLRLGKRLLQPPAFLFQALPLGGVVHEDQGALPSFMAEWNGRDVGAEKRSVAADETALLGKGQADILIIELADQFTHPLTVLRMELADHRPAKQLTLSFRAEHPEGGRVQVGEIPRGLYEDAFRCRFDDGAEPPLALPESLFRLPALGDVLCRHDPVERLAVLVTHEYDVDLYRHLAAVPVDLEGLELAGTELGSAADAGPHDINLRIRIELEEPVADHLFDSPAVQGSKCGVAGQDHALLWILDGKAVGTVLESVGKEAGPLCGKHPARDVARDGIDEAVCG